MCGTTDERVLIVHHPNGRESKNGFMWAGYRKELDLGHELHLLCRNCHSKLLEMRYREPPYQETDEGKYCIRCKKHKPFALFTKNKKLKDGYCVYCKKCISEIKSERLDKLKKEVINLLGNKCKICGTTDIGVMSIHHPHGRDIYTKKGTGTQKWVNYLAEIEDHKELWLMCHNCHTIAQYGEAYHSQKFDMNDHPEGYELKDYPPSK
jgi:hypothetical protein